MYKIRSPFGEVRAGFEQQFQRLDAFGSVFEMKSYSLLTGQYFSEFETPYILFFLLGRLFYQYHFANFILFCFIESVAYVFPLSSVLTFQLLMEFQSPGNKVIASTNHTLTHSMTGLLSPNRFAEFCSKSLLEIISLC